METRHWNRTRLSSKGVVMFLRWVEEQYGPTEIADLPRKTSREMADMILLYVEEAEEKKLNTLGEKIGKLEQKRAVTLGRLDGMKPK